MIRNTKIILCTYDKGGVGKTTLATHITGVLLQQERGQILLVDCDSRPDSWRFYKGTRPQGQKRRSTVNRWLDLLWNPPRISQPPKFDPIKKADLEAYDYVVIDVDSPPEDTIAMISNNHPDMIFVPLNKSQEPSLEELPIFLDTAADVERRANREPAIDYSPEFIVVPLGLSEVDTLVEVDKAEDKPKNCKVASAMENLQNEANEARKLRKYIWEYPGCEDTYEYFSYLLNLGM